MPFKTKRQKLSAPSRRYTFSSGKVSIEGSVKAFETTPYRKSEDSLDKKDKLFLRKDLLKIIVLSSLLVGAQILLRLTLS